MAKRKIINDSKKFQQDFWNYLINPILGYYVKPHSLSKKGPRKPTGE
tara:strand:- start:1674 stop:1814 length:141 start_codon:yes stop_codon:yes gene_type:complete